MAEVIVALDVDPTEAWQVVERIDDLRWVKIGPTLFLEAGPSFVDRLKRRGLRVFLDLKWHDIPHQVAGAVSVAAALGVDMATLHASGGVEMMEAAVRAAGQLRLAAVSVLTSHTRASYGSAVGRPDVDVEREVIRLAQLAVSCGLSAVVCSPHELKAVRTTVPRDSWLVTPGVRPRGSALDDQERAATPREAAEWGATHLVIGRPVTRANDPAVVYREICEGLE